MKCSHCKKEFEMFDGISLTKEDRKELNEIIANKIFDNFVDKWKLRELIRDDLNRMIFKKIDFEPIIKEATKSYKRSLGARLGQNADRTIYELFTNLSQRVFRLEEKFAKTSEEVKK
jgi:hypothetical protein